MDEDLLDLWAQNGELISVGTHTCLLRGSDAERSAKFYIERRCGNGLTAEEETLP